MPFSKRRLCSEITFIIVAAGLLLSTSAQNAEAQPPQYTCRPNAAGDGWICASTAPGIPANTAGGNDRYNSGAAVLPEGLEAEAEAETETETETEAEAEVEVVTEVEAGAGAGAGAEVEVETETETEDGAGAGAEVDAGAEAEVEVETEAQTEVEVEETSTAAVLSESLEAESDTETGEPSTGLEADAVDSPEVPGQVAEIPQTPALESEEATAGVTGIVNPASDFELDWVPREAMTARQLESIPGNCCGGFVDQSVETEYPTANPATAPILFRTGAGLSQITENLITIDGDVVVQQGYRRVRNDETTNIDRAENTVLMAGNVVFREPGLLLLGDSAYIDSDDSLNRVEAAQYVLHDFGAHGQAASLVYNSESGLVSIENGEFSRCEPDNKFWKLQADSIVLDQSRNRGYARNASLRLGNFPIFYYPFTLPFPLGDARSSGFLAPSTGSTRSGGFDFELPYYFNLAPHYDATLSPRLISDRGVLVGLETRYLAGWSMNTLNLTGLSGDKLFDPASADMAGSDSPPTADRWLLDFEHSGAIGRNWRTFIDYSAVSDEDYFYDLGSSGLNDSSRTHLNRQGRISFNSGLLRAGLNVKRIQIIDPFFSRDSINKPFDRLPQFFFAGDTYLPGGFRVGISGEITSFDRDLDEAILTPTRLQNGILVNGERINLEPELSWSLESPGWFLRTTAKYKHVQYNLENQASTTPNDPSLGIEVYSLDGGLVFERAMSRDGGWTQTLEPRLFYLYSEFENQSGLPLFDTSELNFSFNQLFRDDRFSGGDRIADANQASFALTSRFLNPAGKERARFSLGQIRYFEDRLVSLNNPLQNRPPRYSPLADKSALAGEMVFHLGDNWRVNSDLQWDEDTGEAIDGSFRLRYQRDNDHLFNLAYRFRRLLNTPNFNPQASIDRRIRQTDISAVWPLTVNWKLLGRWNYDHSNSRNLETFAGIEWSNCCATIRVIGREWVDDDELFLPNIEPNRGIFVQFTLNGLGNLTGGGLSSLLSDGIQGFRETER